MLHTAVAGYQNQKNIEQKSFPSANKLHSKELLSQTAMMEQRTFLCQNCQHEYVVNTNPDPPLDLLRSCESIVGSDARTQLDFMNSESSILQVYDDHIARVEATLQELRDARQSIQAKVDARRSLFSARRRIPVEIWRDIFMRVCFPRDGMAEVYFGFETPYSPIRVDRITRPSRVIPLVLSQTCSEWRAIAFAFPDLWSYMWIDLSHLTYARMSLLEKILATSVGHPLTLRLRMSNGYAWHRDGFETLLPRVRQFLVAAFERSEDVEMYVDLVQTLNFEGKLAFPQLRTLTIISPFENSLTFPFSRDQVKTLFTAPSLSHLSTLNELTWLSTEPSRLALPPTTLTSIECRRNVQTHELLAISKACPMLTTMHLCLGQSSDIFNSQPDQLQFSLLSFPLVRELRLQIESVSIPFMPFNYFVLPSLSDLDISFPYSITIRPDGDSESDSGYVSGDTSQLLSLPRCLRQSGCNLKRLKFSAPRLRFDETYDDNGRRNPTEGFLHMFREVFSLSPDMIGLDLNVSLPIYENLFQSTFYQVCELLMEGLLPVLETISIDLSATHNTSHDLLNYDLVHHFLRVLEGRIGAIGGGTGGVKYGRLCLKDPNEYAIDDLPYWEELDERGEVDLEDLRRRRAVLEESGVECVLTNLSI